MGIFKYQCDIITGRLRYWKEIKFSVVGDLWNRLESLESPHDVIFKHFIVAAVSFIGDVVGMGKKRNPFIKVDCKKINPEKFRQLYTVVLCYFSFLFSDTNKWLKADIKKALIEITKNPETVRRIFREFDKYCTKRDGLNLAGVSGKTEVMILQIITNSPKLVMLEIMQGYLLDVNLVESYKVALKKIRQELSV